MIKFFALISFLGSIVLIEAVAQINLPVPGPTVIYSGRPLSEAATILQQLYGKVVTYEEPVLVWRGDLEGLNGRDTEIKWGLHPKRITFSMPAETGVNPDVPYVLNLALQYYHQQSQGTRFQVLTSALGYHIVPSQAHDERGGLVPVKSVLDNRITIPRAERQAAAHLGVLIAAVQDVSHIRIDLDVGAGSARGLRAALKRDGKPFSWGTTDMVARDALIELLQNFDTSMMWLLNCQASVRLEDRFCVMNMPPMTVAVTDSHGNRRLQALRFDRVPTSQPIAPSK